MTSVGEGTALRSSDGIEGLVGYTAYGAGVLRK
jgi:hypothetical protein